MNIYKLTKTYRRKRHVKTYIPTRHIQNEETNEHAQANNTYRGRDTLRHTNIQRNTQTNKTHTEGRDT